jgi:DNA-binding IclR family transcriptional regulator
METSLTDLFASKHGIALLKIFLGSPEHEFYQNELIKESGLAPNTAIKWLKVLSDYGLLNHNWKGGLKIYTLNRQPWRDCTAYNCAINKYRFALLS